MRMKMGKAAPLYGSRVLLFLAVCIMLHMVFPADSPALIGIEEGDMGKAIVLDDLQGNSIDISQHFGEKPLVILFWKLTSNEAYLNYSLDELLFLNDFYRKYHDTADLEIFAVYAPQAIGEVTNSELALVRDLVQSNDISFPVLIDRDFKYFRSYGVIALPSTIMLDRAGKIDFIYSSFPLSARPVIAEGLHRIAGTAKAEVQQPAVHKAEGKDRSNRFYRYALQMYKRGLIDESLSAIRKSMDEDPDNTWAHNLKGVILREKGFFPQSMEEFKKAVDLDSNNIAALVNYTLQLIEKENYAEAEKILLAAPVTDNYDLKIRSHHLLALVYKKTDRVDEAIRELELTVSLFSTGDDAHRAEHRMILSPEIYVLHDLSMLYTMKGQTARATETLHQAMHMAFGLKGSMQALHISEGNGMVLYE